MRYTRTLLAVVMGIVLVTSSVARGDDVEDLRATFEQFIAALNQQDLDGIMALWHEQAVGFGPDAPFPMEGKAAVRQIYERLFSNSESLTARPMNPQYRVIGSSGSVIWTGIATVKPKDGPLRTSFLRGLQNWVKVDGQWRLVGFHLSYVPSGN